MARPRVFISSTCYDLNDARAALTAFLEGYEFEVLNSQLPNFGVRLGRHSHQACLDEVETADLVLLLIGGRRGGNFVGSESSITNEEIYRAQDLGIPVVAFVDIAVNSARPLYHKNPQGDFSSVVDDKRIFDFVGAISAGHENNWLHEFRDVQGIITALKHQFSNYLRFYLQSQRPSRKEKLGADREPIIPFPSNLNGLVEVDEDTPEMRSGLRAVHDALSSISSSGMKGSFQDEQLKAIWVVARYGTPDDRLISVNEPIFRGHTWGSSKGKKVFQRMEGTGISGEYDVDDREHPPTGIVTIRFEKGATDDMPGFALHSWVRALVDRYGDRDGLAYFKRVDMRAFSR